MTEFSHQLNQLLIDGLQMESLVRCESALAASDSNANYDSSLKQSTIIDRIASHKNNGIDNTTINDSDT